MKLPVLTLALSLALGAQAAHADAPWVALPARAPAPASNPTTPAKVELGRLLFNDKRLSESATVSCSSCHNVAEGGADRRPQSSGVHGQPTGRHSSTVLNTGFLAALFLDGRAASLEDAARMELLDPISMGMKDAAYVADRVDHISGYRPYFDSAFGAGAAMSMDNITRAIAAYERSLVTPNSAYDRFVSGDGSALSAAQQRGMATFRSVGCSRCHQGPAFDGPALQPGTPFVMKFPTFMRSPYVATFDLAKDQGRYEATGKEADRHQWRVPSLRNLTYTAPYLHNGAVATLPDVVRVMGSTELNRTLTDPEVGDIVAFLESLSGPLPTEPKVTPPGTSP
jgi:cytochrome c peroxidase